jgi:hypothetical protein
VSLGTRQCRGDRATCLYRGAGVVVTSWMNARTSWPRCRLVEGTRGGRSGLLVDEELARAVRCASALAVAHWWGVAPGTVRAWRRAQGVERRTEGSARLWREHGKERVADALTAAAAMARDPERRRKIGAAQRGRPMPEHVREALRGGRERLGEPEVGRRISEKMRARGAWPPAAGRPWTEEEDEAARTLPTAEAAAKTGRTAEAVSKRRRKLRPPAP